MSKPVAASDPIFRLQHGAAAQEQAVEHGISSQHSSTERCQVVVCQEPPYLPTCSSRNYSLANVGSLNNVTNNSFLSSHTYKLKHFPSE